MKGQYAMAVGSAVGACTLLVTLGYGSVILFATTRMSRRPVETIELSKPTKVDAIFLLVTALVALGLAWEGSGLDLKDGIILGAVFLVYVVQHYRVAAKVASSGEHTVTRKDMIRAILFLVAGGLVIIVCAERFVDSMLHIAKWIGISPVAVAIVISPIASELPEKMTAYLTVMRDGRLAEISICNFIGSKVNHNSLLLAVLPFVMVYRGGNNVPGIIGVPFIVMTALTIFASISLSRRKLKRRDGWIFLSLYLALIGSAYAVR